MGLFRNLTFMFLACQSALAADWSKLNSFSVRPVAILENVGLTELKGPTEFVTNFEFFPIDKNGQRIKTFTELEFGTVWPDVIPVGRSQHVGLRGVPLKWLLDDAPNAVAFVCRFSIWEDDFFLFQEVMSAEFLLTPQGLTSIRNRSLGFGKTMNVQPTIPKKYQRKIKAKLKVELYGRSVAVDVDQIIKSLE